MTVEEIFSRAVNISSAERRKAFLDEVFSCQPESRSEVESLLQSHDAAGSFLDKPIVETHKFQDF